ncbi:LIC11966 family surface protein [Sphingobacterium sp. SYP-B4668]|uniref:LIC11966 family surface protein n=1 Tax=Sphingobacterium sp. SYP-B4668 TaxID=2996035 RepID=UPI0022DE64D4|nr:hypothetical protein [Sphingobacterium sp. SYP-B4668]
MKKIISKTFVILPLLIMIACGTKKDPIQYNNDLMTVINGSEKHITDMNTAMQSNNYEQAEKVQKEWYDSVSKDIKKVEDIGDFNGDANLQNAILTGLKGYKKIVEDDYPKLIELRKNKVENPANEEKLLNNINQAFEVMANGVNKASSKFEKDYAK